MPYIFMFRMGFEHMTPVVDQTKAVHNLERQDIVTASFNYVIHNHRRNLAIRVFILERVESFGQLLCCIIVTGGKAGHASMQEVLENIRSTININENSA